MHDGDRESCALITVGVAEYDDARRNVPAVGAAVEAFVTLFAGDHHGPLDNVRLNLRVLPRADETDVRSELKAWAAGGAEVGVMVWSGHCERDSSGFGRLVLSDGSVAADTLADWLASLNFRRWVVIVDGCFSESVVQHLYRRLDTVARGPDQSCVLIASSDATTESEAGVFTSTLTTVLAEGPERGWWSTSERFLFVEDLIRRLDEALSLRHASAGGAVPKQGGRRQPGRVFPNPRYRARSLAVPLDEAHFLPKARGIEGGQLGWFFTGRQEPLRRIVSWLEQPGGGLFLVTGPAGVGKSALIGRIITLSVPEYRRLAAEAGVLAAAAPGTVPSEGVVTAAFHARERRVDHLLDFLGEAVGAGPVGRVSDLGVGLAAVEGGAVVVVDALDEAAQGHARRMVDEVLVPLSRLPGVKVLVGARPGVCGWADVEVPSGGVVDLAREPGTARDIVAYSEARLSALPGSSYAGHPELAAAVARGLASRALSDPLPDGRQVGSFLVARLLSRLLATRAPVTLEAGWERQLPSGFAEVFEADLAALPRATGRGRRAGDQIAPRGPGVGRGLRRATAADPVAGSGCDRARLRR